MSCEREVIQTVIDRIIVPTSCPQTVIESQEIRTDVIERLVAGPPGAPGPPGSGGSAVWVAENGAGSTILAGQVVYTSAAGLALLASATDNTKRAVALARANVAPTVSGEFQTNGVLELTDWSAVIGSAVLTPGANYWLSETQGMLQLTPAAGVGRSHQRVGQALGPTAMSIFPINYGRRAI